MGQVSGIISKGSFQSLLLQGSVADKEKTPLLCAIWYANLHILYSI